MTTLSIREFSHNMAKYLKKLRAGEGFILKYRNETIGQLVPTKSETAEPAWKKPFKRIKLKGNVSASDLIIKMRREDWR